MLNYKENFRKNLQDFLQKGVHQVAAGYVIYGT